MRLNRIAKHVAAFGALFCFISLAIASPSYTDPSGSNPDLTFYNPGGAAGDFVDLVPGPDSVGTVKLGFWVFKTSDDSGFYYAYQLVNIDAGSVANGPSTASLKIFDLAEIAPHDVFGNGGGRHGGAFYTAWLYGGDNTTEALWIGNAAIGIDPGESSPTVPDTAPMFELYSGYGPGDGILHVTTTSGGGYTGQSISVWMPIVPEPSTVAGLLTGGLALLGLRRRSK
jgi:hypothetical protein